MMRVQGKGSHPPPAEARLPMNRQLQEPYVCAVQYRGAADHYAVSTIEYDGPRAGCLGVAERGLRCSAMVLQRLSMGLAYIADVVAATMLRRHRAGY